MHDGTRFFYNSFLFLFIPCHSFLFLENSLKIPWIIPFHSFSFLAIPFYSLPFLFIPWKFLENSLDHSFSFLFIPCHSFLFLAIPFYSLKIPWKFLDLFLLIIFHSLPAHFLKNFRHFSCTSQSYCITLPSLEFLCGTLRINKGRDDMFKPNQLFFDVVGLFFCP